jgi:hypothetical protein
MLAFISEKPNKKAMASVVSLCFVVGAGIPLNGITISPPEAKD